MQALFNRSTHSSPNLLSSLKLHPSTLILRSSSKKPNSWPGHSSSKSGNSRNGYDSKPNCRPKLRLKLRLRPSYRPRMTGPCNRCNCSNCNRCRVSNSSNSSSNSKPLGSKPSRLRHWLHNLLGLVATTHLLSHLLPLRPHLCRSCPRPRRRFLKSLRRADQHLQ